MGVAESALSSAEGLHPSCKLCTAILESLRGLRKFLTVLSFDETLFISIACPLSSLPREGGDVRGGYLDSSLVAAFASLGSLWFPVVRLGRLADHGYTKQLQPASRDESSGLRKFLTVLSFDETLFIPIACPLSSLPRDGGVYRLET